MVVKRGREREVEQVFEKWDLHAVRVGAVTTDNRLRVKDSGVVAADIPNRALTDEAPVYHRPDQPPDMARRGAAARPGRARAIGRSEDNAAHAAGLADHREQALDLPAVRPHGAHEHHRAAGSGVRRGSREGHAARAGDVGGRQRALRVPRSAGGREAGGGRVGAQRRMRRRPADRRHQQPQLRQPREARDHVAVRRGRRRHRRGLPRAGDSRSPAATSASTTRPTASRSCRRRCSASSASSTMPIAW